MSLASEQNFVEFFKALYEKHPQCFKTDYNVWTEKYQDEDWFAAVYIRTIMCNDNESEKLFLDLGKYNGMKKKFTNKSEEEFKKWFDAKADGIVVGGGVRGAHRPRYFNRHNSRGLYEYIKMTYPSQKTFFMSKSYDETRTALIKKIYYVGPLTAFDIQNRLLLSKHKYIENFPEKAYNTGGGPFRGLKLIYGDLKNRQLMEKYHHLGKKIQSSVRIEPEVFWSELEDIICIYQKSDIINDSKQMLSGSLAPETLAQKYAHLYCKKTKKC
jgi:hypothetical protein